MIAAKFYRILMFILSSSLTICEKYRLDCKRLTQENDDNTKCDAEEQLACFKRTKEFEDGGQKMIETWKACTTYSGQNNYSQELDADDIANYMNKKECKIEGKNTTCFCNTNLCNGVDILEPIWIFPLSLIIVITVMLK